jgi:hypothetical protein
VEPPDDLDCDSYLLAALMEATSEGRQIIVKGSVSLKLLSNLIEYQSAWHKWLPEEYSIVDIQVESTRENERPVSGAICAFSGGVDSMFSVWMHSQNKNSYRSQHIKLCSLVHGFDIPLSDTGAFYNVTQKSIKTLDDIGIKLIPIKTNYREISCVNWEHTHAAVLVAALANFKSVAGTCLIGSSNPYNHLHVPWGSTPTLDFLLSSDEFIVMHDGASHSRPEKVKAISEWNVGIENLRVCWQGRMKDRNCGVCEKCVRTKLNFLASGVQIPGCFEDDEMPVDLKRFQLKKPGVISDWTQIIEHANRNHIDEVWLDGVKKLLKKAIWRKTLINLTMPKESHRRLIAKKVQERLNRH